MTAPFRQHLLRRFLLGFSLTSALLVVATVSAQEGPVSGRPASPGSVEWLIETHDCWTDRAPSDMRGLAPGHAILTWPGAAAPAYVGGEGVETALAHVFDDRYPRLVVHAFCR